MGKGDNAHFYRYRPEDNLLDGGFLGMELTGKWADIMKKDGMIVVDSRGKVLGEYLIDLVIDSKRNIVRVLHRFSE